MSLYTYLPSLPQGANRTVVCAGAEWYKFPSSFFLPGHDYRLQFVRSDFDGLLPRPFAEEDGGTRLSPPGFNDRTVWSRQMPGETPPAVTTLSQVAGGDKAAAGGNGTTAPLPRT